MVIFSENIGSNPEVEPSALAEQLESICDLDPNIGITGSVSLNLQVGVPLEATIGMANDVDILVVDVLPEEIQETLRIQTEQLSESIEKGVNYFPQQSHIQQKLTKDDLISFKDDEVTLRLVPIGAMMNWDLELLDYRIYDREFSPDKFEKYLRKLRNYKKYCSPENPILDQAIQRCEEIVNRDTVNLNN